MTNHPQRGSITTTDPIRGKDERQKIETMLIVHPRNGALFIVGCNTNLRASDLTRLTVGQMQ